MEDCINFQEFNDDINDHSFIHTIKVVLEIAGYVKIQNFYRDRHSIEKLCTQLGNISYVVNNVCYNEKLGYHTDGNFLESQPEFYALYYTEQANFKFIFLNLLSSDSIINQCLSTLDINTLNLYSRTYYPFSASSVSLPLPNLEKRVVKKHIIDKNKFRYCAKSIENAIHLNPKFCTSNQIEALNQLTNIVDSSEGEKVELSPSSIVIVNNNKMLHKIEQNKSNAFLRKIRIYK